ncbi:MAG: phospholipid carrier-dependent glycosyltransferase [Anaerolineales bacterium]|nr:phospholipid carrier-dependent glycosyltransferase [Anaerolineales bacterium]
MGILSPMTVSTPQTQTFLQKHEWLLPLGLFILFLALTLPGISWGAPSVWHPDEIVVRSLNALFDNYKFSETNFDYPDLPQYVMLFLGKLMLAIGQGDNILVAARVLSAVLAGMAIVFTYIIARRIGGSPYVAALSGLLLISVSEMPHNGRFAHNDTYLIFFVTLAVLCLLNYVQSKGVTGAPYASTSLPPQENFRPERSEERSMRRAKSKDAPLSKENNKIWLYAAFFTVGLATSSKFTGVSLILAPLAVYLIEEKDNIKKNWLVSLIVLSVGGLIAFWGFGLGTPKVLVAPYFYLKHLLPTLQWQTTYGYQPDSIRGIFGQYGVTANGLGLGLMLLFGIGLVWAIWKVIKAHREHTASEQPQIKSFTVILIAILALDLPMMISYNYQLRYFLTLMPFLAIFSALFIEQAYQWAKATSNKVYPVAVSVTVSAIILYSLARIISLMLLVMHDARIPASAFMDTLPAGSSLEHTFYPPTFDGPRFEREYNYPIYFTRDPNEPLPQSKKFKYNVGEEGLNKRETDYFIVDSFTSRKFNNIYFCEAMPTECAFFKQLETGGSDHYKLLKEFKYTLPPYLPQIQFEFINPSIRIYERIP